MTCRGDRAGDEALGLPARRLGYGPPSTLCPVRRFPLTDRHDLLSTAVSTTSNQTAARLFGFPLSLTVISSPGSMSRSAVSSLVCGPTSQYRALGRYEWL